MVSPTEHDVTIGRQLLTLPRLQWDVGDLLWQAATVLADRATVVHVSIMQVMSQGEGRVVVVGLEMVIAEKVISCQLHDDVRKSQSIR